MKTETIPIALHSLCTALGCFMLNVFDPVFTWVVGANRGFLTVRSTGGTYFEKKNEMMGLCNVLYEFLAKFGRKTIEMTSFTGKKAIKALISGKRKEDFRIVSKQADNAPPGVLIRVTFNEDEKKEGENYHDLDNIRLAISPLIEAHGSIFPLPTIFYNGNRLSI